jgi:hypothetical protein
MPSVAISSTYADWTMHPRRSNKRQLRASFNSTSRRVPRKAVRFLVCPSLRSLVGIVWTIDMKKGSVSKGPAKPKADV